MTEATQLDKVIARVEKLVEKQKVLEAENFELKEKNMTLTEELKDRTSALKEAKERLEAMKLASTLDGQGDKSALRTRINDYIKEIDRCILFLSK